MERLRNTVVTAQLLYDLDNTLGLRLASIAVGEVPPHRDICRKNDPFAVTPFTYKPGVGELICQAIQLRPSWEGTGFSSRQLKLVRDHILVPAHEGRYSHLRATPTRCLAKVRSGLPRASHFSSMETRPPLTNASTRRHRPVPMAIAMQLDFTGRPFIEAAITTLIELGNQFGVSQSCISLYPTVQYIWEVDPDEGQVLDIAGAVAQRKGYQFAHMGITTAPIRIG